MVAHTVKVVASDHIPVGIPRTVTVCTQPSDRFVDAIHTRLEEVSKMATQLCEKCKQAHPGRVCDSDEKGECSETTGVNEAAQPGNEPFKDREDRDPLRPRATEHPSDGAEI